MYCRCGLSQVLFGYFNAFGLGEFSQAAFDLFVSRNDVAQIAAEQILVEMLNLAGAVTLIPQTAGIRGDFVGQQQRAVGSATHFDF